MGKTGDCPTCGAPVNIAMDWNHASYYFDTYAEATRAGEVAALREEVRILRIGLSNARALARRMISGRQAAEARLKDAGLLGPPSPRTEGPDA